MPNRRMGYAAMRASRNLKTAAVLVTAIVGSFAARAEASILVPGTANPYLSGQPSGTLCCDGDSAPAESPVLALSGSLGGDTLTFAATGGVSFGPGPVAPSPDGWPGDVFTMVADYGTGISGPMGVQVSGLVGVFIGSSVPSGPAPAQLNDGMSFTSLAPGLDQIFWIGDGLTGTGTGSVQSFLAPSGATRLYLGVVDGFGWYNNPGVIDVTINGAASVPEPSTWAMVLLGLAGLGFAGFRRMRNAAVAPR
jgi:PEP-CTERM motif